MSQTTGPELNRPDKIHALTSLRFFAALYVVLYHSFPPAFPNTAGTLIARIISLGYLSVSFFFLLSGYILAVVYLRSGAPVRKANFYIARFARVYPLFLMTMLADVPDILLRRVDLYGWWRAVAQTLGTLVVHLFMLQAWVAWLRGIDPPNWSLSVETVFYLSFPFIGYFFWRMRGLRLVTTGIALWISGQLITSILAPHVSQSVARFSPIFHFCSFPIGILLARWQYLKREQAPRAVPRESTIAATLLFSLAVFASVVFWGDQLPGANLNSGLLIPIFAAVIWACSEAGNLPARLLSVKWLVILGEASFGLYLIHMPVHHLFMWMHWDTSQVLWPIYLGICIGLSLLSFYFVETPSRKWILHRFKTHPKETMETASDAQ
jgi:peptidoglycan/LPS O-acetylase OafA/YrhL